MPRPLQARSIGGLLDDVFRQYRTYFVPLLIISLVFLAPILILDSLVAQQTPTLNLQALATGQITISQLLTSSSQQHAQVNWLAEFTVLLISLISLNVTSPLSQGAFYALTRDTLLNDRTKPSPWAYVKLAVTRWGAYLGTLWLLILLGISVIAVYAAIVFLAAIGQATTFVGALLLLVSFAISILLIWLGIRLTFLFVTVFLEKRRNWGAITRTFRLTAGSFWRVFGILLAADIILGLASSGLSDILNVVLPQTALRILGTGIISVLLAPLLNLLIANLYIDLRIRQEGPSSPLIGDDD